MQALLLAAVASVALAADTPKVPDVPARVPVPPGQFAALKIADGVEAIRGFDETKCALIRLKSEDGATFYLVNPREAGQYPVMFRYPGSPRGALTIIDAGEPVPPKPPAPPVDEVLRKKLRDAYQTDGGPSAANEDARKLLAELYRQAADLVLTAATPDALLDQLRRATATLAESRLAETRTAIADEIGRVLILGMAFTDTNRRQAAALFLRLAVALDW